MVGAVDYIKGGKQKLYYSEGEVTFRNCPLCGSAECTPIHTERGALKIVRCHGCGLLYTNPMVKEPEKNYWGDEAAYVEEARLIFEGRARHHRDPNYVRDLKIIEKIKPSGNFLDIGTNMGFFLRHTKGKKWNVVGVEPSPALSEIARKQFGLNVITAYVENANFESNYFDIVTMTDVFEHIPEPKKMLLHIRRILKKDGILFIKVPNGRFNVLKLRLSAVTRTTPENDIFDSYEHLNHYTQETLTRSLGECGFKTKKVLIGRPIQLPAWHRYVGHYYQYPSPAVLDLKSYTLRTLCYFISLVEFFVRCGSVGYCAPNIIVIAGRDDV